MVCLAEQIGADLMTEEELEITNKSSRARDVLRKHRLVCGTAAMFFWVAYSMGLFHLAIDGNFVDGWILVLLMPLIGLYWSLNQQSNALNEIGEEVRRLLSSLGRQDVAEAFWDAETRSEGQQGNKYIVMILATIVPILVVWWFMK